MTLAVYPWPKNLASWKSKYRAKCLIFLVTGEGLEPPGTMVTTLGGAYGSDICCGP